MPEGDTIAKLAARIRAAVEGEVVISTVTRDPRLVGLNLDGARLIDVEAIGKYLLLRFDTDETLYSHLQMDGEWRVGDPARAPAWRRRAELEFRSAVLTALDMPELGVIATAAEDEVVGHLGPNLCGPERPDPETIAGLLQRPPAVALAGALLDQRRAAGFGNVFAVELPFLAGVAPFAAADQLEGLSDLTDRGIALIRWSASGHPRNTTGHRLARADHYLYGLATTGDGVDLGEGFVGTISRCKVCGERVGFAAADHTAWGRASWWCPTCQPSTATAVDGKRLRRLLALHPATRRR